MKNKLFSGVLTAICIGTLALSTLTAQADQDRWASTTSRDDNGNICIDFEDVQVLLPADWSGKCQMVTSDTTASFYQTKSRELWTEKLGYPNGGWLFSISIGSSQDYADNPNYAIIGEVSDGTYYATFPTDLQAYTDDSTAYNEFVSMQSDMDWVKSNISLVIEKAVSPASDGEYIFPESSSAYLSETDLSGMSADEIQMAINEIYARHHRKFVIQSIQDYFNTKSWYDGYIEADDFDVTVMNTYEGANIGLMVETMNRLSTSDSNITILPDNTKDAYGMIIESGSGYFRVRVQDGSIIQFWYDSGKLSDMGLTSDSLKTGATASLIYDADSYEAVNILVW